MLQEFLAHPKRPALSVGLGRKAIVTTLLATADEVIKYGLRHGWPRGLRLARVLNIVSTAALHHLFWPRVRSGSKTAAALRDRPRQVLLSKGR
jgi:hypothetical protein